MSKAADFRRAAMLRAAVDRAQCLALRTVHKNPRLAWRLADLCLTLERRSNDLDAPTLCPGVGFAYQSQLHAMEPRP